MKKHKIVSLSVVISMVALITTSSYAIVKYKGVKKDDVLFTRGCSRSLHIGWVNRFNVVEVDKNGTAWGTLEKATIKDPNFRELKFEKIKSEKLNMSKICKQGGCYTREEEAFSDVKNWMVFSCPFK